MKNKNKVRILWLVSCIVGAGLGILLGIITTPTPTTKLNAREHRLKQEKIYHECITQFCDSHKNKIILKACLDRCNYATKRKQR